MSLGNIIIKIRQQAKDIAASRKYNKREMSTITEPDFYTKISHDEGFVKRTIEFTPETDFCKIVAIEDCDFNYKKTKLCTCTKKMVFGDDAVNGEICEKFSVQTTSTQCKNGNPKLEPICVASSRAGSCDDVLFDRDLELASLREENEVLRGKLTAFCDAAGLDSCV